MLKHPYPFLYNTKRNSIIIILISVVVFLINFLINGDDIVKQHFYIDRLPFSIIFGLITGFFIMIVLEIIPRLFFNEELKDNWTLGKDASLILLLFTLIIVGNYLFILFTARDFHQVFQVKTFLTVALHGMLIGFVPAFIAVLINYTVSLKRNLKEAMVYNQRLLKMLPVDNAINTEDEVCIPSNNKSETIKIIPTQLLYVKSEGNYIELYFEDESKIKKEVYRASIKTIEEALQKYSYIIRTHRCYLVNLQKVKNHKGNARNFQLYFDDSETMVPVSRNNFKSIQDWMGGF